MAKAQQQSSADEDEVYEVRRIKKHKREIDPNTKIEALFYKVAWQGYDDPSDDTWEVEDNVKDTAKDLIEKYWTKVDPKRVHERYKATTAKAKAAKKRASIAAETASSASGSPAKKKTRVEKAVVEEDKDDEDDEQEDVPEPKKRGRPSNGGTKPASGPKKASESAEPAKKRGRPPKKTKQVEEEPEEEEQAEAAEAPAEEVEMGEGEAYDAEHRYLNWDEVPSAAASDDWEDLIEVIDTAAQDDPKSDQAVEGETDEPAKTSSLMSIVWKEEVDGARVASWVSVSVCRYKCPQRLIDFYDAHIKFSVSD